MTLYSVWAILHVCSAQAPPSLAHSCVPLQTCTEPNPQLPVLQVAPVKVRQQTSPAAQSLASSQANEPPPVHVSALGWHVGVVVKPPSPKETFVQHASVDVLQEVEPHATMPAPAGVPVEASGVGL